MAAISVTVADTTKGPFQIAKLFAGNTYSGGVTIAPATPLQPQSKPDYVSVQSDPSNSTKNVYVGDKNLQPAVSGAWGKKLAAGVIDAVQPVNESLTQRYVNGDNGAVINIEVLGGFQ